MTQREAAEKMGVTARWVRKLVKRMKKQGDAVVVHGWHDCGPSFAAEQLAKRHQIHAGRETLRGWTIEAGLCKSKTRTIEDVHVWRPRDKSEHDWL